jgi:hypothetical protein
MRSMSPMPARRAQNPASPAGQVVTHTNRMGDTYYLHEGKTKTGKPRYFFAKTIRKGALQKLPDGFEVSESINGVVSVRRKGSGEPGVAAADLELVRGALRRQHHLDDYEVRAVGSAIVIFEPHPRREEVRRYAMQTGFGRVDASFVAERMKRVQYSPVMKFQQRPEGYALFRMTYRGEGGWSWPLAFGKLSELAKKFVRHVGTDELFELL